MKNSKKAAVLFLLMMITGCTNSGSNNGTVAIDSDLNYQFNEKDESKKLDFSTIKLENTEKTINSFTIIDEKRTALLIGSTQLEESAQENGKNTFAIYEDGKPVSEKEVSDAYQELCRYAANDSIITYDSENKQLLEMNMDFEKKQVLADKFEAYEIKNMDIVGNKLFILAVMKNPYTEDFMFDPGEYCDFGEEVWCLDLDTKQMTKLDISNVICQSCSNGTLYFYSCRDDQYTLDIYDPETNKLKTVRDMDDVGYIYTFAIIGNDMYYCNTINGNIMTKIELNTGKITSDPDEFTVYRNSDFEVYNNELVTLNRITTTISQVGKLELDNDSAEPEQEDASTLKLKEFSGETLTLGDLDSRAIYTVVNSGKIKSKTGVGATYYEYPMYDEELKLKLLAGDSDVDIYFFSMSTRIGRDIRNAHCYAPLTDESIIKTRSKYWDWVADYSVNDNGEIWCLPTGAGASAIYYVPENIEKLGIKPDDFRTVEGLLASAKKIADEGSYKTFIHSSDFVQVMERIYNANYGYSSYDNDIYRKLAESIYLGWDNDAYPLDPIAELPGFTNPVLYYPFGSDSWSWKETTITDYDPSRFDSPEKFRALPYPAVASADEKDCAEISYAIINPNSTKIEAAQAYLGFIADHGFEYINGSSYMFKDKEMYENDKLYGLPVFDDIYELNKNVTVWEAMAAYDKTYFSNFEEYQRGEITLDEFVARQQHKAEVMMNE